MSGNQTFRPISNFPFLLYGFNHPTSFNEPENNIGRVTELARTITSLLGLRANLKNCYCKREKLLVGRCESNDQVQYHNGRSLVLLGDDNGTFSHLICDSECTPIRIDTNIKTDMTENLARMLNQQLRLGGDFPILQDSERDITFGTFFSQHEKRFEINATSFEGHKLTRFASSQSSNSSGFGYWDRNGRVNGIRGNWDSATNNWQKPGIKVVHHAMENYRMIGRVNLDSNTIDSIFHSDLEDCTVGVFFSHGGPIKNNYQVDNGITWFKPGDTQSKYGTGNLRHLIFDTCGAMGLFAETGGRGYKSLMGEWLPAKYVDGLRTACGNDGGSAEADRDGWRFFSMYNKGDSIETCWTFASATECAQNSPVTVAYAGTPEEALAILSDGRFCKDRVESTYSVASAWEEIK